MVRDSITRTGARAPGVKRHRSLARWCISAPASSTQSEGQGADSEVHEGQRQTARREELAVIGKAMPDIPALEPDWGKLTVRNLRGDDGNGGIIRSPIRAIVLLDF